MNAWTHTHASQHTAKAFNLFSHFPFAFAGWLHTAMQKHMCLHIICTPTHNTPQDLCLLLQSKDRGSSINLLIRSSAKKKGCKTSASLTFYLIYTMISGCNNPLGNHFSYKSAFYVSLAFKKQLQNQHTFVFYTLRSSFSVFSSTFLCFQPACGTLLQVHLFILMT